MGNTRMVYNITVIIRANRVTTITFPSWVGVVSVLSDRNLWYDHENNPVISPDVDKSVINFSDFRLGGFIPGKVIVDLQLMCDCRTIKLISDGYTKVILQLKG